MKSSLILVMLGLVLIGATEAKAGCHHRGGYSFGFSYGGPSYYYAPAPVYIAPPVYAPPAYYYSAPGYYRPPAYSYGRSRYQARPRSSLWFNTGRGHRHRHHDDD